MNRAQRGFTIIEIVVVVILLGILVATALPRFMSADDETHHTIVAGVMGGLQTGVSLYHAQWIAERQPVPNTPLAEFGNLRTNAAGFPYGTADRAGGTSNVTTSADCAAIFDGVLQGEAPSITSVDAPTNVVGSSSDFTAVVSPPNCAYYYTAQASVSGLTVPVLTYTSATGLIAQGSEVLP